MIVVWFFLAALVYSSAGFGGGSTYTALLVLHDVDHRVLPMLSLMGNLIVVSGSCWRFARRDQMPWGRCVPLVIGSVPMAIVGGAIPLSRDVFVPLLSGTLIVAGGLLLIDRRGEEKKPEAEGQPSSAKAIASQVGLGAALGLLAGLVGIGGGIFLSPLLHLTRWSSARQIAATCSLFILVNSVAGLIGQISKFEPSLDTLAEQLHSHAWWWPWMMLAILVGGQIGNRAASNWFSPKSLRRVTAVIVLAAGARLVWV